MLALDHLSRFKDQELPKSLERAISWLASQTAAGRSASLKTGALAETWWGSKPLGCVKRFDTQVATDAGPSSLAVTCWGNFPPVPFSHQRFARHGKTLEGSSHSQEETSCQGETLARVARALSRPDDGAWLGLSFCPESGAPNK